MWSEERARTLLPMGAVIHGRSVDSSHPGEGSCGDTIKIGRYNGRVLTGIYVAGRACKNAATDVDGYIRPISR